MEHPTYEQLLSLVEGTSPAASAKELMEHLDICPQCAAEVAGWQRTIQKLQNCEWPKSERVRPAFSGLSFKWAAAAVLILGIGFGFGRFSPASTARLKQQVRDELKTDLLAALATSDSEASDSFRQQFRREFSAALNHTLDQSTRQKQRTVQELLRAVEMRQDENQRMLLTLVNRVRQQHEADYLSLRRDLETAASVADNDLQQNQQRLSQLAATLFAKGQD